MSEPEAVKVVRKRSGVERVVVWGGIVLLLGLLVIELRARQAYNITVNALNELPAATDGRPFTEFEPLIQSYGSLDVTAEGVGEKRYTYRWFSVIAPGRYVLNVIATDSDPITVLSFSTGEDAASANNSVEIPDNFVPATDELPSTASPG